MKMISLEQDLKGNAYPGRGIVIGRSQDGKKAVTAYFIMGRSENSRNRIFVEDGEGIRTQAFDPAKMTDPSLVIYAPVRVLGNKTIVTNGDQTDTIYESMDKQMTFEQALRSREFEPDAPNYTLKTASLTMPCLFSNPTTAARTPACAIPLPMKIAPQEKDILSIPTRETAVRCPAMKGSPSWWGFRTIWKILPSCYGTA